MTYEQITLIFLQSSLNLIWLGLGLFLAGVIEAFFWKTSLFQYVNFPINESLFGVNKKWRGLISLPIANLISTYIFQLLEQLTNVDNSNLIMFSDFNVFQYGLLVGFIFNLAELPNSFIKRRLNIPPGDESNQFFFIIDHMDSTYGVVLLWWLYFRVPSYLIIIGLILTPLLFMGATWLRRLLGLK